MSAQRGLSVDTRTEEQAHVEGVAQGQVDAAALAGLADNRRAEATERAITYCLMMSGVHTGTRLGAWFTGRAEGLEGQA